MVRLFFYTFKEFVRFAFVALLVVVFLLFLWDFSWRSINYFSKYNASSLLILKYYTYQIPMLILQALPVASLVGSLTSMTLLGRTGEFTAMRTMGMSTLQIAAPLLTGGLMLVALAFGLSNYVIPRASVKMFFVKEVLIEGDREGDLDEDSHWVKQDNGIFYFKNYNPHSQVLSDVTYLELTGKFRLKHLIKAEAAHYQPQTNQWRTEYVRMFEFDKSDRLSSFSQENEKLIPLNVEWKRMAKERRSPDQMSFGELSDNILVARQSGGEFLGYQLAWYLKSAFILIPFLIVPIGLPFGFQSDRKSENVRGVFGAIMLTVVYWLLLSLGRTLGMSGMLHPFLAGWLASMGMLLYMFFHLKQILKA